MQPEENKIVLGAVWYPVTVLGYGKRLGVWFQGCAKNCADCISPEFKDFSKGRSVTIDELKNAVETKAKPDGLTISGGEPFDQPEALLRLVSWFAQEYNDDILIFTGYSLERLHDMKSPAIEAVLEKISVLIDGEYVQSRHTDKGLRGSDNQKIHVWRNKDRYAGIEEAARTLQCVMLHDRIWMIGIPV